MLRPFQSALTPRCSFSLLSQEEPKNVYQKNNHFHFFTFLDSADVKDLFVIT
jgi:hypothetical protein